MAQAGVSHSPHFLFAAGEFHRLFHQPAIQFSEIAPHLVAAGSFMNTSNCPGLDTNGFAMLELSLNQLCSFPFYHTFSYSVFCYAFCQFSLPGFPAHRFLDDL